MAQTQTYLLHTIPIHFHVDDEAAAQRLADQWCPFRAMSLPDDPAIHFHLAFSNDPVVPPDLPMVSSGPDVTHFRHEQRLVSLFHGWGRFDIDLTGGVIEGKMARAAIRAYGVFEDMILLAMTPLLRRRGYFPIHAFAAAVGERAIVLLGDIGAGKTTTGISLLTRGARLIANDAPLVRLDGEEPILHAYPGLISAYPDSIARFPGLNHLLTEGQVLDGSKKISFPADAILSNPWTQSARPGALLFPTITPEANRCSLESLTSFQALQRLVGQSIETWDTETIPAHLHALRQLVDAAPAYHLTLARDITDLPDLLFDLIGC